MLPNNANAFAGLVLWLVLKTGMSMNILSARAVSFFNASLKTHKKSSPAFLFCAILIFIDLTKKQVGGILKERKCPNIWSSPQVSFCPKRTQDRYSGSDWAVIFFSLLLIKVGKNGNNCADYCCYACNNSNKSVKIHCTNLPSN